MSGEWERRKSLRASGGRLGNGRSGELKGNTWPGRSEQGLETDRDTEGWGGENVAGRGTLSHNVIISCFCFAMTFCFSVCPTSFSCVFRIQRGILLLHYVDSIFRMTWVSSVKNISIISVSLSPSLQTWLQRSYKAENKTGKRGNDVHHLRRKIQSNTSIMKNCTQLCRFFILVLNPFWV